MSAGIGGRSPRATPYTHINEYLGWHGYEPVGNDATIHDCYLCILHFHPFEELLGDVKGRHAAIIRAIVEGENHPGISERTVKTWMRTAYRRRTSA